MKELVANIKALNKLKIVEKIPMKGDEKDLKEDFISAIEEIDDDGKIGEVDDEIIDFYEALIEEAESDEDEEPEEEEKPKPKPKGKGKAKPKGKGKAKPKVEEEDEPEEEEDEEPEEEEEEEPEEEEDEPEEEEEEEEKPRRVRGRAKPKGKGKAKPKRGGKAKPKAEEEEPEEEDEDEEKPAGLPKGIRAGTLPAKLYKAIEDAGDDGITAIKLAKVVANAKGKVKKPSAYLGVVQRLVARKVAKAAPIIQRHANTGSESDAIFMITDDV
jgi:type IV secretory pathway VirB10-like protein